MILSAGEACAAGALTRVTAAEVAARVTGVAAGFPSICWRAVVVRRPPRRARGLAEIIYNDCYELVSVATKRARMQYSRHRESGPLQNKGFLSVAGRKRGL
jgi:hypothetical protein